MATSLILMFLLAMQSPHFVFLFMNHPCGISRLCGVQCGPIHHSCIQESFVAYHAECCHSEYAANSDPDVSMNLLRQVWYTNAAVKDLRRVTREIHFRDRPHIGSADRYCPGAKLVMEEGGDLIER